MKRVCPRCGNMLIDGIRFCNRCGEKINTTDNIENSDIQIMSEQQQTDMNGSYIKREMYTEDVNPVRNDGLVIDANENMMIHEDYSGLSEKKIYMTDRNFYYYSKKIISKKKDIFIVPVRDITATDVIYTKNFGFLFLSLICFGKTIVSALKNAFMEDLMYELYQTEYASETGSVNWVVIFIGIILFGLFVFVKHIKLKVYFAGGKKTITMNVDHYSRGDILHRNIREVIDKYSKNNINSNSR